ncbi:MAG: DMT family transporter [Candidatus Nanopelagicales bacterium]
MTGVAAALVAAILFSLGGVLQHRSVAAHASDAFDAGGMLRGVRRPIWWLGLGVQAMAVAVQLFALSQAPLATVQTVMATMVIWVLACAVMLERVRPSRPDYFGSALVGAGVVAFVLVTRSASQGSRVDARAWVFATAGCVACAGIAIAVARALPPGPAAAVLGGAAGVVNVLGAGLAGAAILLGEQAGAAVVFGSWLPYGALAVSLASIAVTVMAFAAGPVTAAIPPMIAANPVVGSALGVRLLGQSWAGGPAMTVPVALALAVMICGIVVLARSPIVAEQMA